MSLSSAKREPPWKTKRPDTEPVASPLKPFNPETQDTAPEPEPDEPAPGVQHATLSDSDTEAIPKLKGWARGTVLFAMTVSAYLNGRATSHCFADPEAQRTGFALGVAITIMIFLFGTTTAWVYRAGWRKMALVGTFIPITLLFCSIVHGAGAFAMLTGSELWLSRGVTLTFDCGIIFCEVAAVLVGAHQVAAPSGPRVGLWQCVKLWCVWLWQCVKSWCPPWRRQPVEKPRDEGQLP